MTDLREAAERIVAEVFNHRQGITNPITGNVEQSGMVENTLVNVIAAELAKLLPRWISTQERKPAYGEPVLVVYHGVVQHVTYARDVGEYRAYESVDSDVMPESFVTHWQPLPAPPEATR